MAHKYLAVFILPKHLAGASLVFFILFTSVLASPARWTQANNKNITSREKRQLVTCPGFPGFCSESFPGTTCLVICEFGRNNVPQCQKDGTWTDIPRCIEHEPGVQHQTPGVCPGIPGYCSQDFPGGFCQFDCTDGPDIRSTCTKDGTWEPYPTCQGDIRETRDGCSNCPGPNGGPRDRSAELGGGQEEQPRNIEVSDPGRPQANIDHVANSRQDWRNANRAQHRQQHIAEQGQDRQNERSRGSSNQKRNRPNIPSSGNRDRNTQKTQSDQRRKQGQRVDWEKDEIRFVNPVNVDKNIHEDRPVWNRGNEKNEDQFQTNFGSTETNGANRASPSLSSTGDFTLDSKIERFPSRESFPTVSSKVLDYPIISESVTDFSLLSNPFEGFPSFDSDHFQQVHVGNHEKQQNGNVHVQKIPLDVESQSEKHEEPKQVNERKQDLPKFKNTHGQNFRSIFGISPERTTPLPSFQNNFGLPIERTTPLPSFQNNFGIPTERNTPSLSFQNNFGIPIERSTPSPSFQNNFGLPVGEGLPNDHQNPLIEDEQIMDLSHNTQINVFLLEQEIEKLKQEIENFENLAEQNRNQENRKVNRLPVNEVPAENQQNKKVNIFPVNEVLAEHIINQENKFPVNEVPAEHIINQENRFPVNEGPVEQIIIKQENRKVNRLPVNGNVQVLIDAENIRENPGNAERVDKEVNRGVLNSGIGDSNPKPFNEAPRFIPGRRRNGPRRRQPGRKRSQRRRPHLRRQQITNQQEGNLIGRHQQFDERRQQNRFQDQLQRNSNQDQHQRDRDQDQLKIDRDQDQIQRDKSLEESREVTSENVSNVPLSCPREQLAACVDICPGFNHVVYGACVAGCSKRCNRN